ncbi:malate/lactate/ureidoglycolate dehydrogenase [uncultured Enterovirga sp.]|uniref:malate/lactate/ureidoglycolate dehydrogenase n=1 Tax=uncultured Enterovirga sp. TaxID=2026352 RepID=UPI0035C9DC89
MAAPDDLRVDLRRLHGFVAATFAAAGCSAEEADAIATGLVDANLTGHDSHGVVRVPRYLLWLSEGEVEAGRNVAVVSENAAMAVLDGQYGFGATVGREAVRFGIEKARETGVAIVALRHAGHLGRIGQWAEMALEAGLASLHIVNVAQSRLVAPFGGVEKRFSTAPIAFGFPVEGQPPVVLDFATSAVAEGKVMVASQGGKPLPEGSLITPQGALSTDPATLYGPLEGTSLRDHAKGEGAIRAMGEHKGSGLALMCELLGGVLAGSGCSGPPGPYRFANGMVSIYMSPAAFGSDSAIAAEARAFIDFVRDTRPAEPGSSVLIPGDPERRARADRTEHGIPISRQTWESLVEAGRSVGLARDDPRMLPDPPPAT